MSQCLEIEMGSALLTRIKADPFFTPESLGMKNYFDYDKSKVEWYRSLLSDLNFHDLLKVWSHEDELVLIDNYEYYRALQDHHSGNPEILVPILKITGGSKTKLKELSLRLKMLHSTDSHLTRCINIKFLLECGCTYIEIKELYGVKKSSSAQARQIQRDYKLVKNEILFNRVIGVAAETTGIAGAMAPSPHKATLQYGMALNVLSILPDDQKYVEDFNQRYGEYLKSLQESFVQEDEITKAVFSWSKYSKDKVKAIAASVARGTDRLNFDYKYLIGDGGLPDQKWSIKHSEFTNELVVPQLTVNLGSKAEGNIKKILELTYKTEALHFSLLSYLKRIHPAVHGSKIRVQSSEIAPYFETVSNIPKFEDKSYFEFIQRHKLLYYCNRELLLKSIELKAHNFGFEDYQYDSQSTYEKSSIHFKKWFDEEFLRLVNSFYNGKETRHPKYSIYVSIRSHLDYRSGDKASVYFGEFINQLFSAVFADLDIDYAKRKSKAEVILASDRKLKDITWKEIINSSGKVEATAEEIRNFARNLLQQDEDRLVSEIHKLNRVIQTLSGSHDRGTSIAEGEHGTLDSKPL
jgi:hypothetical protein